MWKIWGIVGAFETSGAPDRLKDNLNVAQNRGRNDLKTNVKMWVLMEMEPFFSLRERQASQYVVVGSLKREVCGGTVICEEMTAGFWRDLWCRFWWIFAVHLWSVSDHKGSKLFSWKFVCRKSAIDHPNFWMASFSCCFACMFPVICLAVHF